MGFFKPDKRYNGVTRTVPLLLLTILLFSIITLATGAAYGNTLRDTPRRYHPETRPSAT